MDGENISFFILRLFPLERYSDIGRIRICSYFFRCFATFDGRLGRRHNLGRSLSVSHTDRIWVATEVGLKDCGITYHCDGVGLGF
jgi:hypothetical protein